MKALTGKLQTFSLSDNPNEGRKYINTNINFGVLRRYFLIDTYDPMTDKGEQRVAKTKHINKLRKAVSNNNYTPESFNVTVPDLSIISVDDKGNVNIPLSEENKLIILNGGSRFRAMESLWQEGDNTSRKVDNLPIPLIVQLNPENRKPDFLNLNAGMHVSKSHLQCLQFASGNVTANKLPIFDRARAIAKILNQHKSSPLHNKIDYGNIQTTGGLQASQLWTDHKGSLIASLYGAVNILNTTQNDDDWFVGTFNSLYHLVNENTDYTKNRKMLALPPDGAKGNLANWLSIVNTTIYYLYLRSEMDQPCDLQDNQSHILDSLKIYNQDVGGNVSRVRRVQHSQAYAQKLFAKMEEDDNCPTGFHFGIPIPLYVLTSYSSFGVTPPESSKGSKTEIIETVDETKIGSDTDPAWEE